MSAATDEREIAERIVDWLGGLHPRGTSGVKGNPPYCSLCGSSLAFEDPDQRDELVAQIREIISEGLHS